MPKRRELVALVREAVLAKLDRERVYTSRFAEELLADNESLAADLQFQFALDSMRRLVRDCCKEAAERETVPLFPELGEELPRAIAVPKRGEDDPYYVSLRHATGDELSGALLIMDRQIASTIRRRDALFHVHQRYEAKGGTGEQKLVDVLVVKVAEAA